MDGLRTSIHKAKTICHQLFVIVGLNPKYPGLKTK